MADRFPSFFFNDTATTEIYALSLHDALPISRGHDRHQLGAGHSREKRADRERRDRKSTRLNSSHSQISYAVFCLKKKKHQNTWTQIMQSVLQNGKLHHASRSTSFRILIRSYK